MAPCCGSSRCVGLQTPWLHAGGDASAGHSSPTHLQNCHSWRLGRRVGYSLAFPVGPHCPSSECSTMSTVSDAGSMAAGITHGELGQ